MKAMRKKLRAYFAAASMTNREKSVITLTQGQQFVSRPPWFWNLDEVPLCCRQRRRRRRRSHSRRSWSDFCPIIFCFS